MFVATGVVEAALVGWWSFDEAGGTNAADFSGSANQHDAALLGAAAFAPGAGQFGGALWLNGSGGTYAEVADHDDLEFLADESFTVSLWYKRDGIENDQGLISKGYQSPTRNPAGYYMLQTRTGGFTLDSREGAGADPRSRVDDNSNVSHGDNLWHHFVVVRDSAASQIRLYVDNQADPQIHTMGNGNWAMGVHDQTLVFGNHFNRYTQGYFDDIAIWKGDALGAGEIDVLYNAGVVGLIADELVWNAAVKAVGNWGESNWLGSPPDYPRYDATDRIVAVVETAGAEVTVEANHTAFSLEVSQGKVIVGSDNRLDVAFGVDATTIELASGASLSTGTGGSVDTLGFDGTAATPSTLNGPLSVVTLTDGGAAGFFRKAGDGTLAPQTVTAQAGTVFQVGGGTLAVGGANPLGNSTQAIELDGGILQITANSAGDGELNIDFGQTGAAPLQAGFGEFLNGDGGALVTQNYATPLGSAAAGDTVNVSVQGNTHSRNYAAITGGDFLPLSNLLSDNVLSNSGGNTINVTLADLEDGFYEITTYHHNTQSDGNQTFDLNLTDANGADQLLFGAVDCSGGTTPASITTKTFGFEVSGGNDVIMKFGPGGAASNHIALNGFELGPRRAPIGMSNDVHVTNGSELAVDGPSAAFGAATLESGILTTSGAPISFTGTRIDPAATRVGINPLSTTDFGGVITGGHADLKFAFAGPGTKNVIAAADYAAGDVAFAADSMTGATLEAAEGRTEIVGTAAWAGSTEALLSGGTLALTPIVHFTSDPGPGDAVGIWKFDDGTGITAVNSAAPGTNDGTLVGMDESNWGEGKIGGALIFDGNDDYVDVAQDVGLPIYNSSGGAYSVAMWVKGGPQNDRRVFSEASTANGTPLINLGTHNSANPTGQFASYIRGDGPTSNHPLSNATPFDGTWHHLAWVDDNGSVKLFVDGNLDGGNFDHSKSTLAINTTTIGAILRGAPTNDTHHFAGMIDEVYTYDRALTQAEVAGMAGVHTADGMTSYNVTVTAPSTLDAAATPWLDLGTLTLDDGAILETTGAPIGFTGTTINGANVGITANVDTTLTGVVGMDAGAHDATIALNGPGLVLLDKPAVGLDAGDAFSLQDGTLGLLLQDAGAPEGAAAIEFAGGSVQLSSAAGDRAWDKALSVSRSGKISAAQLPGGVDTATVTVGSGVNGLTMSGFKTLSLEAGEGHTLNIAGDIVGDGGIKAIGGSVNIDSGAATFTGSTAVSSGEVNLNVAAPNTASVVVSGGVLNLNADVTTNGGGEPGLLNHFGYHTGPNGVMDLNNNGGMMGGGDPTAGPTFFGQARLINGPADRGLNFDNDADFRNTGAIGRNDQYSNMWMGLFTALETGDHQFRNMGDDDRAGIWLDLDQDGVFESSTAGLGSNRGEQLSWEDGGWKTVSLTAGESYMIAFTHSEGGGGSRADFAFHTPSIGGDTRVKPGDAAQDGLWSVGVNSQTTVNAGTLNVADGVTLITPRVTISGGGTLDVKPTATLATGKVAMSSGALTVPHDLNLTELDYSGGVLNLGGNLAVSELLTVGGPLDLTGKTLTTTAEETVVDVLPAAALTTDNRLLGSDLSVAGSVTAPGFDFGPVTVSGTLNISADSTATVLSIEGGSQFNASGNQVVVGESLKLDKINYGISEGGQLVAEGTDLLAAADLTVGGILTISGGGGGLPANPLAYYSFDDPGNVGNDDSGNGYAGSLIAPAAYNADGKNGGALFCNTGTARQGQMRIEADGIDLNQEVANEWTVAAWFQNLAPTGDWRTLFRGKGADHHIIVQNNADNLGSYVGGFRDGGTDLVPDPDVWHHIAAVADAAGTSFYVDGALAGSITQRAQSNVYAIGGYQNNSQRFAEKIDDVVIYGRALSPEEVGDLVNPPAPETDLPGTNLLVTADVGPTTEIIGAGVVNLGNLTIAEDVTQLTLSDAGFSFANVTTAADTSIRGDVFVTDLLRPAGDLSIHGGLEVDDEGVYVVELGVVTNEQGQAVAPRHSQLISTGSGDLYLPALEVHVTGVHASEIGRTVTKTIVSTVGEGLMQGRFDQVPPSPGVGDPATTGHLGSGVFFRGVDYVEVVPPAPDGNSLVEANADVYFAKGGDSNADGNVDGQDIQALIINFNLAGDPPDRNWLKGDTAGGALGRGDGWVDGQDITDLITNFTGDGGPIEPGTAAAEYNPNTGEFTIMVDGVMNWSLTSDGLFAGTGLDALQDILPLGDAANLVSANPNTVGEGLPGASPFGYAEVALGRIAEPGTDAGAFQLTYISGFGTEPQIGSINVVPEPGTLAMLLAGLLGAGLVWWRRRSH